MIRALLEHSGYALNFPGSADICLQVAGSDKREFQVLGHRPEVIDAWATDLRQRFQGRPIAMALELNKGPIVEALRT